MVLSEMPYSNTTLVTKEEYGKFVDESSNHKKFIKMFIQKGRSQVGIWKKIMKTNYFAYLVYSTIYTSQPQNPND